MRQNIYAPVDLLRLASRAWTALRARIRLASALSLVWPPVKRPSRDATFGWMRLSLSIYRRISWLGTACLAPHFGQVVFKDGSLLGTGNQLALSTIRDQFINPAGVGLETAVNQPIIRVILAHGNRILEGLRRGRIIGVRNPA